MAFTLQVIDWRDNAGSSHPEYNGRDLWQYVESPQVLQSRNEAEEVAARAWVEPDCNGVAPVCIVTEC